MGFGRPAVNTGLGAFAIILLYFQLRVYSVQVNPLLWKVLGFLSAASVRWEFYFYVVIRSLGYVCCESPLLGGEMNCDLSTKLRSLGRCRHGCLWRQGFRRITNPGLRSI